MSFTGEGVMDAKETLVIVLANIPTLCGFVAMIVTMRAQQKQMADNGRVQAHATRQNAQSLEALTSIVGDHRTRITVLEDWREGVDGDRRQRRKEDNA